jgi:hypothetical protein
VPKRQVDLDELTIGELAELTRTAISALAERGPAGFAELLSLHEHLGLSVADAARAIAAQGSWSQVAEVSGTSKQAAWSRWSG